MITSEMEGRRCCASVTFTAPSRMVTIACRRVLFVVDLWNSLWWEQPRVTCLDSAIDSLLVVRTWAKFDCSFLQRSAWSWASGRTSRFQEVMF